MVDITSRRHPLVLYDHLGGAKRIRCTLCGEVGTIAEFLGPLCTGTARSAWVARIRESAEPELGAGAPPEMKTAPVETTGAAMPSRVCSTHEDRTPEE